MKTFCEDVQVEVKMDRFNPDEPLYMIKASRYHPLVKDTLLILEGGVGEAPEGREARLARLIELAPEDERAEVTAALTDPDWGITLRPLLIGHLRDHFGGVNE